MFITTSFKLVVSKEEKEQILKLMRNFSSAVRFSYKRLLEGFIPSQAYTITRQKFPELNSHYVNCAVEKARRFFKAAKQEDRIQKRLYLAVEPYLKNSRKIIFKEKD
jgi:predicted transposase